MTPAGRQDTRHVTVDESGAGARLDRVLADALPGVSRSRIKALITGGSVAQAGARVSEPSRRVKPGETFEVRIPEAAPARPVAQPIPLAVAFEDDHLIVVDKPAGLVVHPAAGNPDRTLVNALLAHCGDSLSGIGGVARPGIVHRIDKDTSGLLVAAKNDAAHASLARQFAEHSLERAYQAVCWGAPSPREGTITGNIGRHPRNRKKMSVTARGGKEAVTHYRVLRAVNRWASLVECRLETGRTHQIRVHLSARGHPIIGDPLYGRAGRRRLDGIDEGFGTAVSGLGRQALHACVLGFEHPNTGEFLRFRSGLPDDMKALL
ncbi:MAG: RluA family pseudouridine synthase [Rhodospirillales bacterium]|nr:RluA family pseudouridine synthase [Rhodospirillales bacterium]